MNGAPVKVGEVYDVSIEAVGEKGDGIARVKGFVLFVRSVEKGDYVKVKVTRVMEKVGFAEVVGKPDKPLQRESKYATVTARELDSKEEEQEAEYEDTEDFGEKLNEEE